MKKIKLALFVTLILFTSCDERYEEERGLVFEGTWTLILSVVNGEQVYSYNLEDANSEIDKRSGKFFTAKKYEDKDLLLFYSGGYYDSSYFYRIKNNDLFVRRVSDTISVIEYYILDSNGDVIQNEETGAATICYAQKNEWNSLQSKIDKEEISIIDTVHIIEKPVHPKAGSSKEKYYGTLEFDKDKQTLIIYRYYLDSEGNKTDDSYGRDEYLRPSEIE
ncbi:MAG: hypothetical protein LBS55_04205 [Prevotellaceae bacterium]|jgi:hypothetical protein|nr:hypothetical protein [Prevotellaceae bacterium]